MGLPNCTVERAKARSYYGISGVLHTLIGIVSLLTLQTVETVHFSYLFWGSTFIVLGLLTLVNFLRVSVQPAKRCLRFSGLAIIAFALQSFLLPFLHGDWNAFINMALWTHVGLMHVVTASKPDPHVRSIARHEINRVRQLTQNLEKTGV